MSAFVLTAFFLLGGCAEKTALQIPAPSPAQTAVPQEELISEEGIWQGKGGYYRMSRSELGDALRSVMVYEDEVYNLHYSLGSNDFSLELRRGLEVLYRHMNMKSAAVGISGIWIVDDVADYDLVSRPQYHLKKLDGEGKELLLSDRVLLFDGNESLLLGQIPLEGYAMSMVPGGGGIPYIVLQKEDSGSKSVVVRPDTESLSVEYEDYKICGGNEKFLYTLLDNVGLYGVASPGEKPVPIAIWTELGTNFYNPSYINWLSDGSFIVVDRNITALLTPEDSAGIKRETYLTLAYASTDFSFRKMVEDFNMSSNEYIVNLRDYTQKGELSTRESFLQKQLYPYITHTVDWKAGTCDFETEAGAPLSFVGAPTFDGHGGTGCMELCKILPYRICRGKKRIGDFR